MSIKDLWDSFVLFLAYLVPFLPSCPAIGRLKNGDCIFVQAFGRGSIADNDLGKALWDILKRTSTLDETFTILKYGGFRPGMSNRALAKYSMKLSDRLRVPIISQWEVAYCIWEDNPEWFFAHQSDIDCLWPPEFGYYATWHVKLASCERMRTRGKNYPIEVSHPAMLARATAIIYSIGVRPIVEPVSMLAFFRHPLWVWDRDSIQPWTTKFIGLNPINSWLVREIFGRFVHHPFKRWISFQLPS